MDVVNLYIRLKVPWAWAIMCRVKPHGKGPRTKWRQLLSLAQHFGNVPHPWAFPIVKNKVKAI